MDEPHSQRIGLLRPVQRQPRDRTVVAAQQFVAHAAGVMLARTSAERSQKLGISGLE